MIDIHAHILPGIDDGPRKVETALKMAAMAVKEGIHTMIATPHCCNGVYNPAPEAVIEGCRAFNGQLKEADIPLTILPGAEIHLVPELVEMAGNKKLLTLNNAGKYILLELPERVVPPFVVSTIKKLRRLGITPVIAHPERNASIQQKPEMVREFVYEGAMTQVTAKSLTGWFKNQEKKSAITLLEMDAVHFLASDAHSTRSRCPLLKSAEKQLVRVVGESRAREILVENPEMLIAETVRGMREAG